MEPRFGRSFADVRVHAGGDSERAAGAFDAHAFTVGKEIYFGRGAFLPGSMETRATIAHELAHVVQQERGARPMVARQSIREKWSALWDAGPVDSYRASELATEALQAARNTGLDGLEDGPADAWRHCYWNCRMVQVIGKEDAAEIATNHERYGKGKLAAGMMDIWNNEEGRACSGNCDSCCQDKLDAGKLWILHGGKVGASERTNRRPGQPRVEKYDKY